MKKLIKIIIIHLIVLPAILLSIPGFTAEATETGPEPISTNYDYAVGSLVAASQGAEYDYSSPTAREKISNFGKTLLDNAVRGGKDISDIIQRSGKDLLFKPFSLYETVGNAWKDFTEIELTEISNKSFTINIGSDGEITNSKYSVDNIEKIIDLNDYLFPSQREQFTFVDIYGSFSMGSGYLSYRPDGLSSSITIYHKKSPTGQWTNHSEGYKNMLLLSRSNHIQFRLERNPILLTFNRSDLTDDFSTHRIDKIVLSVDEYVSEMAAIIPYETTPTAQEVQQRFSSTFKENFDQETGEIINNNTYVYNYDQIVPADENTTNIINNEYITNNYTTIINEAPDEDSGGSGGDSGGGFDWGALFDLMSSVVDALSNLGTSIIDGIATIFEPWLNFITDIFDWLTWFDTDYMTESFDTMSTEFNSKFPDFTNLVNTDQEFTDELPDTEINLSFLDVGTVEVMNIDVYKPYFGYIKTILSAVLYLTTFFIIYIKITGGSLND